MNIKVYKDGKPVGYIRSVNHNTGRFSVIQSQQKAKGYRNQAEVMGEIDMLTKYAFLQGYIFTIS